MTCGCRIEILRDPIMCPKEKTNEIAHMRIIHCPLHAAADQLLYQLKYLVGDFRRSLVAMRASLTSIEANFKHLEYRLDKIDLLIAEAEKEDHDPNCDICEKQRQGFYVAHAKEAEKEAE